MPSRHWMTAALVGSLAFLLVACSQDAAEPSNEPAAGNGAEAPAVVEEAAPAESLTEGEGATETESAEFVYASGTVEAPPTVEIEEVERPEPPAGIQRFVDADEAREVMPFPLMVPATMPEDSSLTIVQIVEPAEGQETAGLPAARLIYDVDLQGVLVVYQGPATGDELPGEPATVGGQVAALESIESEGGEALVLTWERDGVRYELRGRSIDQDTLMAAAESLTLMGPGGVPAP